MSIECLFLFVTYTGRDKNETIKPSDTLLAPNANRDAETANKITTISEPIVREKENNREKEGVSEAERLSIDKMAINLGERITALTNDKAAKISGRSSRIS